MGGVGVGGGWGGGLPSPTLHGHVKHLSPQAAGAVGSARQQQLAAVRAAVVRLQETQGEVVGDAAEAGGGGQVEPLLGEVGGGAPVTLRVVQHLHRLPAPLTLQAHPLHGQALPVLGETGEHGGAPGTCL